MRKTTVRRLERFRSKKNSLSVPEKVGVGKRNQREARVVNLQLEKEKTKKHGKLVADLVTLDEATLRERLAKARKELLDLRFQNVTGQLTNVASIGKTRRQIARLLTVLDQKGLGA